MTVFPQATDWDTTFRPSVLALLSGQPLPDVFFSPLWVLFPLIPFALLPYDVGRALMLLCAIGSFGYTAYRFGAKPLAMMAFVLSPLAYDSMAWGNVEWIVLLGFVTVSPVSILLLLIKPQMTLVAILYLVWQAWKRKRLARMVAVPMFAVGMMIAGGWMVTLARYSTDAAVNASLFPLSLAIGLPLAAYAFRYKQYASAVASSPCFAPTLSPQSWQIGLLAIVHSTPAIVAVSVGLWIFFVLLRLGMI